MKKGAIYKSLNKADKLTKIANKFDKFCATPKAENLVIDVDRLGINDLLKKYNLQYLKGLRPMNSESTIRAFIRMKLYKNGINHDYTHIHNKRFIRRKDINFKLPWNLTKEDTKLIWDKKNTSTLGYADRLHRIQVHKMNKWEKRNKPTYKELKEFLFPNMLIKEFYDKRDKKAAEINEDLNRRYVPYNHKIVMIRYYKEDQDTYANPPYIIPSDEIIEESFNYIHDPNNILEKSVCFYSVKDKYIKSQAIKLKKSAEFIHGERNFICLKVLNKAQNRVTMWI